MISLSAHVSQENFRQAHSTHSSCVSHDKEGKPARRQTSPSSRASAGISKLTHRRPIGGSPFGQRLRAVHTHLQPSCVLYIVHGQTPSASVVHGQPPSATGRHRRFVTTSDHGSRTSRSHSLCTLRATRANIAIVHRTSYMGRPRLPPSYIANAFSNAFALMHI